MEEMINLIVNNGIGVGALCFLMYFVNTTMKENTNAINSVKETLVTIQTSLISLTERVDDIEKKVKGSDK